MPLAWLLGHPIAAGGAEGERFGLELEEFGGDSLRLSAVPAILNPADCEATVRALAEDLEGLDNGSRVEDALRKIAALMACHAAVNGVGPKRAASLFDAFAPPQCERTPSLPA